MSSKPLTFLAMESVIPYMEANQRMKLAMTCPALKSFRNKIPLKIFFLQFEEHQFTINDTTYRVGIIQKYPEDLRPPEDVRIANEEGGVQYDIDQYGFKDQSEDVELMPGDLEFSGRVFRDCVEDEEVTVRKLEEKLRDMEKELWVRRTYGPKDSEEEVVLDSLFTDPEDVVEDSEATEHVPDSIFSLGGPEEEEVVEDSTEEHQDSEYVLDCLFTDPTPEEIVMDSTKEHLDSEEVLADLRKRIASNHRDQEMDLEPSEFKEEPTSEELYRICGGDEEYRAVSPISFESEISHPLSPGEVDVDSDDSFDRRHHDFEEPESYVHTVPKEPLDPSSGTTPNTLVFLETEKILEKIEDVKAQLLRIQYKRDQVQPPWKNLVQMTVIDSSLDKPKADEAQKFVIGKYERVRLANVMKHVYKEFFGNRKFPIHVQKLHVGPAGFRRKILRLPENLKLKIDQIHFQGSPDFCDDIIPIIDPTSFPLSHVETDDFSEHTLIKTAKSLEISCVYDGSAHTEYFLALENQKVFMKNVDETFTLEDCLPIIHNWMEHEKPVGTCFIFSMEWVEMEILVGLNTQYNGELTDHRCFTLPMGMDKTLKLSYEGGYGSDEYPQLVFKMEVVDK